MITLGLILLVLNALFIHVKALFLVGLAMVVIGAILNFTALGGDAPRRVY